MFTSIYCMDKIKNDEDVAKMYDHIRENGLKLSFFKQYRWSTFVFRI